MNARVYGVVLLCLTTCLAGTASATTLLDTRQGIPFSEINVSSDVFNFGGSSFQSSAIAFSVSSPAMITEVVANIGGQVGHVHLGIMASDNGNPSGTFLTNESVEIVYSTTHGVDLTSLDWALPTAGTYWLAAVADPFGDVGTTVGGFDLNHNISGTFGYQNINSGNHWNHLNQILPEVLIVGTTPLPAALPLFASGLGALGLLGWRRKRRDQA